MSDFLSSDPDEFDRQIHDHFSGIGKGRTVLSGTWRRWMNEECENSDWLCLAAWDDGDDLIAFTMQDPDKAECVHTVEKRQIDRLHAARTFAAIDYLFRNPRLILLPKGFDVPEHLANPNLYCELVCLGFEGTALMAEYEALGGEYA